MTTIPTALGTAAPQPQTKTPHLTPQFCFSTTTLKDFLRLSRHLDDTLLPALNALHTPSRTPSTTRYNTSPHAPIPNPTCSTFLTTLLFPTWHTRTQVLEYCASVAAGTDEDEDTLRRREEDAKAKERKVDERLDPYSGRYFPRETRREVLEGVVRNEEMVEGIVRERSWRLVGERCEGFEAREGWRGEFEKWRKEQGL